MFGIDVNRDSHPFSLYINGRKILAFSNPLNNRQKEWEITGRFGVSLNFRATMIDKYDDLMGYAFLNIPVHLYDKGKPIRIRIQGETANSKSWYMTFKYPVSQGVVLTAEPAIIRKGGKRYQLIRADILCLKEKGSAQIRAGNQRQELPLELGLNRRFFEVEAVKDKALLDVKMSINGKMEKQVAMDLLPVKPMTLYLLHHSHVDVGYTHDQKEVEKIQWQNLHQAVALAEKTRHYPLGSRFKWNTEVMWAVDSYLKHEDKQGKVRLIKAVKEGSIELGALYANLMTGLCRPEELVRITERAREFSRRYSLPLESAMITDIPGMTGSMVQVLAKSGIKYLSMGVNRGHRIGDIIDVWGDKPFYWLSPSGREKILCWIPQKGYSHFHTGLGAGRIDKKFTPGILLAYIEELLEKEYPYNIAALHYNIGSDNGPPDADLADLVKEWNSRYETPVIKIATVSELFREFEERYGNTLPQFHGDFTSHWEDGAGSTARETAMNRRSADKLVQASILRILLRSNQNLSDLFKLAWQQVLMFSEHTWGAWNSISDPQNPFVKNQWRIKQKFATAANTMADQLLKGPGLSSSGKSHPAILTVINTLSWLRTELVYLSKEESRSVGSVLDDKRRIVPSQRLSSGQFVFIAPNVPALGTKSFYLSPKKHQTSGKILIKNSKINNGCLEVQLNDQTGAITHIKDLIKSRNYVDTTAHYGLNQYLYVKGRKPDNPQPVINVRIRVKERGPVVASYLVTGEAQGCKDWQTEVVLVADRPRVDMIHRLDKKEVLSPEGVHVAFPFDIPGGQARINTAWGYYRPGLDQLPGSCKNFFTQQRWVDISNNECGVTWVGIDAPLVEIGRITTDPIEYGWIKKPESAATIFSYIMNNYWETNFKASQPGKVEFVYSIRPHDSFDPVLAEKFGMERCYPLIYQWSESDKFKSGKSLFTIKNRAILVSSMEWMPGEEMLLRLYNAGPEKEKLIVKWESLVPKSIYLSNLWGDRLKEVTQPIIMFPHDFITLRIVGYSN